MVAAHPTGRPLVHRPSSPGRLRYVYCATNVSYEEYHPYGTTAWWTDPGSTVSQKRYRYTGKEKDEESGLYYHGARFCAGWLGRWTSADPIGVADGVNRYAYVRCNPIRHRDPTGTFTVEDLKQKKNIRDSDTVVENFQRWTQEANLEVYGVDVGEGQRVFVDSPEVVLELQQQHDLLLTGWKEPQSAPVLRLIDDDWRIPFEDQRIKTVNGERFAYTASFGKYMLIGGAPIDVPHFFKYARLAADSGSLEWFGLGSTLWQAEEYFQATNENRDAATSAMSPEDLLSNELGLLFGWHAASAPADQLGEMFATFVSEMEEMFTTGTVQNGTYITTSDVARLQGLATRYFGITDLTEFSINAPGAKNLYSVKASRERADALNTEMQETSVWSTFVMDLYVPAKENSGHH